MSKENIAYSDFLKNTNKDELWEVVLCVLNEIKAKRLQYAKKHCLGVHGALNFTEAEAEEIFYSHQVVATDKEIRQASEKVLKGWKA